MKGALIGNAIGVPYEFSGNRDYNFDMLVEKTVDFIDDDSLLTMATANALMNSTPFPESYLAFAEMYPNLPYGHRFRNWVEQSAKNLEVAPPYGSMGNGSAMRVSAISMWFSNLDDVKMAAELSAACTHSHSEGIMAAVATAAIGYMMCCGKIQNRDQFADFVENTYPYQITPIGDLRKEYQYTELATGTMNAAVSCLYYAESFEGAVRNACSIGGDADTIATIVGGWAEHFWIIPPAFTDSILPTYPFWIQSLLKEFYEKAGK